jgi:hypothetical protein
MRPDDQRESSNIENRRSEGGMGFGGAGQAAFGPADTSGNSPFLSRLAAARWAFSCVASIISVSGLPPLAASSAKMRLNTPRRLQRMNRL